MLTRRTLALYAFPAFAVAVPTIPIYVFLPTFYAETMGLGLAATGLALLVARAFDVVTDPLVGIASDRLRLRWGRRKPWIAVGAVVGAVSLYQLLSPPEGVGTVYLAAWAVALYVGWTLVSVPYNAWGAELSGDYHERSRITGAREAVIVVGILSASFVPAVAAAADWTEAEGLEAIAWLTIAAGAPAFALLLARVPEPPAAPLRRPPAGERWRAVAEIASNRPFLRLLGAWFVNGLANGLPAVLFPLYLQHGLEADRVEQGMLIATYFLAAVLAIPLWLRLSRRYGKHRTWCAAMIVACAAFVWVPLLEPGAIGAFLVICIVTGASLGADLALPPAMQADVIDLDRLRSGKARAGVFFALWGVATKAAAACAVGFAFPALELFGFRAGADNAPEALFALAMIYAALPCVLKAGAIAVVWNHPITANRQMAIRRRLEARARRSEPEDGAECVGVG